ncbi:AEC family transporter [Zooshikella ganghwensis]|uniref:AEC family transporter n=1 Tax=Zooshikella ganghwensis TaxID=202772 RepID=UPI0004858B35|nr:AEC family transporter [Zooshikella ganghwensis]
MVSTGFLMTKVSFLFILVMIGFTLGKRFTIELKTISTLLLYLLSPIVVFSGIAQAKLLPMYSLIPIFFFLFSLTMALIALKFGRLFWQDNTRHLFALSCSTGNTGYFGLPVAMAILDETGVALVIFAMLGITLFEYTAGFYITARGQYDVRKSIQKLIRLPFFYAFLAGLLINLTRLELPSIITDQLPIFKSSYTMLGMMMIGFALSSVTRKDIDWKLIGLTTLSKYLLWPCCVILVILLDQHFHQWLDDIMIQVMLLISVVPLAANTIALAVELNVHPQKASVAVLTSTALGVLIIPVYLSTLTQWLI